MPTTVTSVLARLPARLALALLQAGVGFVATPYLTRALGPADFGLLGLTFCAAAFAQHLGSFCAESATAGAAARLDDATLVRFRNGVLTISAINFLLLLLIAGAIALVLPDYAYVLVLAPILGAVRFLDAFEQAEGGEERLRVRQAVLEAASGAFALALTVVLISGFGLDWPARVAAIILADLVVSGVRYGVLTDKLSRYRPVYDLGSLKHFVARGAPLMVAILATLAMNHADRLIALDAFGLVQVGYFVAAFRVATMLTGVNRTVAATLVPLIGERIDAKAPLGGLVVLHLAFGGAILLIGLGMGALFLDDTDLILGAAFAPAAPIIAIVCGAYALQGFQRIAGIIRQHFGLEAPNPAHVYVALAVHVALSYALIPSLGAYGIAIGVVAGYALTTTISVVTAYRRLLAFRRGPP